MSLLFNSPKNEKKKQYVVTLFEMYLKCYKIKKKSIFNNRRELEIPWNESQTTRLRARVQNRIYKKSPFFAVFSSISNLLVSGYCLSMHPSSSFIIDATRVFLCPAQILKNMLLLAKTNSKKIIGGSNYKPKIRINSIIKTVAL